VLVPNNDPANNNWSLPANPASNATIVETTKLAYANGYGGVSCRAHPTAPPPGYLYFNSPADVVNPANRALIARSELVTLAATPTASTPGAVARNSALVLNNVVSFHVRVLRKDSSGGTDANFVDYNALPPYPPPVVPAKVYDTSSPTNLGLPPPWLQGAQGIRALQIIIRAWDPASQQSRQVTFIQDM
jgi:hypothetical protein